jgi:ribosomal protein S12 methylthiotransferase
MTTVSLISLGCPKNTVDSETLLKALRASGIAVVENPEEADILAVNTCGFIEDAKRESIDEILRLAGLKANGKRLVVFGCLAQRYRDELRASL